MISPIPNSKWKQTHNSILQCYYAWCSKTLFNFRAWIVWTEEIYHAFSISVEIFNFYHSYGPQCLKCIYCSKKSAKTVRIQKCLEEISDFLFDIEQISDKHVRFRFSSPLLIKQQRWRTNSISDGYFKFE